MDTHVNTSHNATHGPLHAALSFSTFGEHMDFDTHTTAQIDVNGSHLQGRIDAGYEELVALFGEPTRFHEPGEKVDAEWALRFKDETVATIYNYKDGRNYCGGGGTPVERIRDWHIGGFEKAAIDRVQIAIDLFREMKESKPSCKSEEVFETANDMMAMLRNTKGHKYAVTVEVAMLSKKRGDLMAHLLAMLCEKDVLSEKSCEHIMEMDALMSAMVLSKFANLAELNRAVETPDEIMNWADRMCEVEQQGALELMKEIRQKQKGKERD